jgi:hypothetical protein
MQFQGRSKDTLATLLLTRFTDLKTLELGDGFLMYSLFLPHILKRAANLLPKLDVVIFGDQKLGYMDPGPFSYMDLDLYRPIFYHPSITAFEW